MKKMVTICLEMTLPDEDAEKTSEIVGTFSLLMQKTYKLTSGTTTFSTRLDCFEVDDDE